MEIKKNICYFLFILILKTDFYNYKIIIIIMSYYPTYIEYIFLTISETFILNNKSGINTFDVSDELIDRSHELEKIINYFKTYYNSPVIELSREDYFIMKIKKDIDSYIYLCVLFINDNILQTLLYCDLDELKKSLIFANKENKKHLKY